MTVTEQEIPRTVAADTGESSDQREAGHPMLQRLVERIDQEEQLRRRAVQDAISSVHVKQLRRRADQFDAARPKPGDFTGSATAEDLAELDKRMAGAALGLRQKAALLEAGLL